MTDKPSWQARGPDAPLDPQQAKRMFLLIAVGSIVMDVAVAAWLVLGPVEMETSMRWLVAGFILLSAPVGLFLLRRALLRATGA